MTTAELAPTADAAPSEVFGVRCFAGSLDDAVERVIDRVLSRLGGYAVLCNVHVLMSAQDEPELHQAVDDAWLVFPDGAPVAWLQRRQGVVPAERVGGPDLMLRVLDRGRARQLRHVFLGSTDPTLRRLEERVKAQLRDVEIAGTIAPPFGDPAGWTDDVIARVRVLRPDVVWLALGAPKQETWMRDHAAALAPAVVLGVGAAFDFHAETKKRAPRWMQRSGLEWAHRLGSEPTRLGGRYLRTNTAFVARVASNDVKRRLSPRRALVGDRRGAD